MSGYPGMMQSSMGSTTMTSTSSRSTPSGMEQQQPMGQGFPPNSSRPNETPTSGNGQFPFGQQFECPDRYDQSSPNMAMRSQGPSPGMGPTQQTPGVAAESGSGPMYPGSRFPGPGQPMVMRPPGSDAQGQYPPQGPHYPGQGPAYTGPQYPNYPQSSSGPFPGPRPPHGPGGMYGTPNKMYTDDPSASNHQYPDWSNSGMGGHMTYAPTPSERQAPSPDDRMMDGAQWSPMQRSRMPPNSQGYMPPAPPSTPPMVPYGRQMGHRNSPQSREGRSGQQKMPPSYGGLTTTMTKKELAFPPDSVESVNISTTKRKKLTHKDLAPFEAWRLMLSLKSGLLAESSWALDTLNVLLFDDTTHNYFTLGTLPGLLEVLTEHFRHCLMLMFDNFEDLEEGQSRKQRPQSGRLKQRGVVLLSSQANSHQSESSPLSDTVVGEDASVNFLTGTNWTMVSRKGLPVKIDSNPPDLSVLEVKDWDLYSNFDSKSDHWLTGKGDLTDHILTHFESDSTNKFLSRKFKRKRRSSNPCLENDSISSDHFVEKRLKSCVEQSDGVDRISSKLNGCCENDQVRLSEDVSLETDKSNQDKPPADTKEENCSAAPESKELLRNSTSEVNHSSQCNGEKGDENVLLDNSVCIKTEPVDDFRAAMNEKELSENNCVSEDISVSKNVSDSEHQNIVANCEKDWKENEKIISDEGKPLENGDIEEPKLSPMVNHLDKIDSNSTSGDLKSSQPSSPSRFYEKENGNCSDSSPPVLKAECLDGEEEVGREQSAEPMNSTMNCSSEGSTMEVDTSALEDPAPTAEVITVKQEAKDACDTLKVDCTEKTEVKMERDIHENQSVAAPDTHDTVNTSNDSYVSETEELSASIVADMLKEDENIEEEAFQRDDPPLCVTPESRDELGRRCVCISNIFRSLSCVPGNEAQICKHPGIMRLLGRLLLLHHCHPERPPPRKLPSGEEEEEEREEPPRVYDDEHWWWDYLDQLRENTLVILANICGHLKLGLFSEQVCFPLLEGLLHWVICPASVARDPLPTLSPGAVLSPQRLVLEALCKLCIHETNVDLLLATPPIKRLLELFNVLVRLLSDRNHQITREFSIVLMSLLVPGDSSAARAVALQHPCVCLLVDFLETAEQNALAIANQQGLEVLQNNPEVMGTSLDMLRRAAHILLHMSRVPDNRKMFVQQQSRLLNLVMSQILDQSVSNTLSEVLFECSLS